MTLRSNRIESSALRDLEIRVFARQASGYPVEMTLDGEQEFPRGWMPLETGEWLSSGDLEQDGARLYQAMFGDPRLLAAWSEARGAAEKRRVRLRIDPEAPELHALPWELLSEEGMLLAANPNTPFSRYLPIAMPWSGVVEDRPIRVLVVISNPSDLESRYKAAPVDVPAEQSALEEALKALEGEIQVEYLTEGATLMALEARLRAGYHVLHYVGHGLYNNRTHQGALLLEDDSGLTSVIPDDLLAGMLARLPERPRLVFLVACQSAARAVGSAFLGLAPRLVQAGVPAVVAMQDLLTMLSGKLLGQVFYQRLAEHGLVDQALNEARAGLVTAGRVDAHVPVLFMRLKSGALWSDESDARGRVLGKASSGPFWSTLITLLKKAQVVPVLGPRVHGRWLPGPEETARCLVEKYDYPFKINGGQAGDLSRVGQYLATSSGEDFLPIAYMDTLKEYLSERLPADRLPAPAPASLSDLVKRADWKGLAGSDPNDVHFVLSGLGLPLYLTTNADNLLEEALRCTGRMPVREQCLWNDELQYLSDALTGENVQFNNSSPLVYHLLGVDEEPRSLVISEDQYFNYLYNIAMWYDRFPSALRGKLATSSILFVGFGLYDWQFRVVMHGLVKRLENRFRIRHVAVQLDESSAVGVNEESVQNFLTQYFSEANINVYWGSTAQFIAELREEWQRAN